MQKLTTTSGYALDDHNPKTAAATAKPLGLRSKYQNRETTRLLSGPVRLAPAIESGHVYPKQPQLALGYWGLPVRLTPAIESGHVYPKQPQLALGYWGLTCTTGMRC